MEGRNKKDAEMKEKTRLTGIGYSAWATTTGTGAEG
jgi:hypothetical protein